MAASEDSAPISGGTDNAGFKINTASKGGTVRETFSMSKTWLEAREHHGESELLDAIVAEKPKLDESRDRRSSSTTPASRYCSRP